MSLLDMLGHGIENLLRTQNKILEQMSRTLKNMDEKLEIVIGCMDDGPMTKEQELAIGYLCETLKEQDPDAKVILSPHSFKTAHDCIKELQRKIRWSYKKQTKTEEE